jgi:GNAT superfamily N-acetyltransferase
MAPVAVRAVNGRADLAAVLDLPFRLHAGDPCWVPFLRLVDRRRIEAFRSRGELVLFLAERDGRVVGTISALRDQGHEQDKGDKVAWFGFFECEDDPEACAALVEAACAQARSWGLETLRGPRNLTRVEFVGLTVEGYDRLPPFIQGHHPPYYLRLLEGAGFVGHHDVLAYEIPVGALPPGLRAKADACSIPGLVIRATSRRTQGADLLAAHEVLNSAYRTVPDTSPMPRAAFLGLGRTFLAFADPRLLQIALVDGRPVGFAACFPELNEALVDVHGSLFPLGWARLLRGLRRVRTASFKLIGVVPELRGTGLHAALIRDVVEGIRGAGYERLEASVIDERNGPMRAVVEHAGMTVYRRYRFLERRVGM